jgi:hypothetical protein
MSRAGFEPATPAIKRPQTYTLDRAATGIGNNQHLLLYKYYFIINILYIL